MPVRTLTELFLVAARYGKPDCLLHKVGGEFVPISTAELVERVQRLAKALGQLGVVRGDRVALMAENGPHWPAVDFATLCIGAVLVPIYPTLLPEGAAYIVADSGAKVLFVQGEQRLEALLGAAPRDAAAPARGARRRGRAGGRHQSRRFARAGRRGRRRGVRGGGQEGEARGPRDPHLHQRHHRQPQGGDAHPRQHRFQRQRRSRVHPSARRLHGALVPAALALLRAHGRLHLLLSWGDHRLRRVGATPCRRTSSRRGRTSSCRCRASTRSSWPACSTTCRSRRSGGRSSSTGRWISAARPCHGGSSASERQGSWEPSSPSPTGWCSRRSRRGWAAASSSPFPAARRWRASWPSSSGPPGCRSTRATGSPRPRRC